VSPHPLSRPPAVPFMHVSNLYPPANRKTLPRGVSRAGFRANVYAPSTRYAQRSFHFAWGVGYLGTVRPSTNPCAWVPPLEGAYDRPPHAPEGPVRQFGRL